MYENIESVDWKTAPPLAVGSRIAFVARFLGRRLAYTYELRTIVPGECLVMATSEGPFPMAAMRLANRKDLARLKAILESETSA